MSNQVAVDIEVRAAAEHVHRDRDTVIAAEDSHASLATLHVWNMEVGCSQDDYRVTAQAGHSCSLGDNHRRVSTSLDLYLRCVAFRAGFFPCLLIWTKSDPNR